MYDVITLAADREQVEQGDISDVAQAFKRLRQDPSTAREAMGKVGIVIGGYDDDPRPLWEIPEARLWFPYLDQEIPYLLFFLSPERKAVKLLACMLCDIHYEQGVAALDAKDVASFLIPRLGEMNVVCDEVGVDNYHLSERIFAQFGADI